MMGIITFVKIKKQRGRSFVAYDPATPPQDIIVQQSRTGLMIHQNELVTMRSLYLGALVGIVYEAGMASRGGYFTESPQGSVTVPILIILSYGRCCVQVTAPRF